MTIRLILFIFIPFTLSAQVFDKQRHYSDTLPSRYDLNLVQIRERVYQSIPAKYKNDIKRERRAFIFAHENALMIKNYFASGELYSDWPECEDMVNSILKQIIPKELEHDTSLHAYILKNGSRNAFMTGSGHMLVNIGLIADVRDEAVLAAILAHEVAHYYLHHNIETFFNSLKNPYGPSAYFYSKKFHQFSRENELEADSLAIIWLTKAGYNINSLYNYFELDSIENLKLIDRYAKIFEYPESTHPTPERRLERAKAIFKSLNAPEGESYQLDKEKFVALQNEARPEALRNLMSDFELIDCSEAAFRYHIMDPSNQGYIYYLMESIRKICYLNSDKWRDNFITGNYFDLDLTSKEKVKKKRTTSLFDTLNLDILLISEADTSLIAAKRYWLGKPKFTTNEEAFEYFYSISQQQNIHECILVNALSLFNNKPARDKYLTKYLSHKNIMYREYAEILMADSIYESLDSTRIIAIADFTTGLKLKNEDINLCAATSDTLNYIAMILDSVAARNQNAMPLLFSNLSRSGLNELDLVTEMQKFANQFTISRGSPPELHLINPGYFMYFYKKGANKISFINCLYMDNQKGVRDIEFYQDLVNEGNGFMFTLPQRRREMEIYVVSLSTRKGERMKIRNYYTTGFGNYVVDMTLLADEISKQVNAGESVLKGDFYFTPR
jgi:hypothetical protein